MAQNKRLIFKVNGLEKDYGSYQALKVKKLEIHPGTIYGIIGTVGSGKSTLLNILAGIDKESSGTVFYEDNPYETNWLGRIKVHDDIFFSKAPSFNRSGGTVEQYIAAKFNKKKNVIQNRYFKDGSFKNLWTRNMKEISVGEMNWLGMILACETDPRVLLIDDYGTYFNSNMEKDFRNKEINILAPIIKNRKGHYSELFNTLLRKGYLKVRVDGEIVELKSSLKLDRYKASGIISRSSVIPAVYLLIFL